VRTTVDANQPRNRPRYLLFLFLFLISQVVLSQEQDLDDYLPLEVSGGLGYAQSFDYNLFNNGVPYRVKGGLGYQAALRYYFNYNVALGLKIDGLFEIISDYPDDVLGYYIDEDMYFSNVNIGLEGRYMYGLNRFQPFFGLGVKYVYGELNFEEAGFINAYRGVSINGLAGVGYMDTGDYMVSLEVLA